METNYDRPMGLGHYRTWSQTGIQSDSSVQWHKANKRFKKRTAFNSKRNRQSFRKKCDRESSSFSNKHRFLQYAVLSSKKERGNEARCQFKATQQVSPQATFQNGNYCKSLKSSRDGRLGCNNRSKRCLPSYHDTRVTSKVSQVFVPRGGLSVPSTVFWPLDGPKNLCQSQLSGHGSFEKVRPEAVQLSGRLAVSEQGSVSFSGRCAHSSQSPVLTRLDCKQRKITTCSLSVCDIFRKPFQPHERYGFSHSGKIVPFKSGGSKNSKREHNSQRLPDSVRYDCIMSRVDTKCKVVHEAHSVASSKELESSTHANDLYNTGYSTAFSSFELVVTGSKHSEGQVFSQNVFSNDTDHRCEFKVGLGRSSKQSQLSGTMVTRGENHAHKLSGNESSHFLYQAFPISVARSECSDQIRQHNSLSICQPPRGDQICTTLSSDNRAVGDCFEAQNQHESSSYSGNKQCTGRCIEQIHDKTVRMVTEQSGYTKNFLSVGSTPDRSVCLSREQEDISLLLMASTSTSLCSGCPVNCMAEHVCVCISTDPVDTQNLVSFPTVSMYNDLDCPIMAETTVVSDTVEPVDSLSNQVTSPDRPVDSVQRSCQSSQSRIPTTDCMVVIDQCFSTKGFSKNTRELLAKSWRKGTQRDYKSKFRQFSSWCDKQKVDPYSASLVQCADFLTFLFKNGLKYRTINGYRSMLSAVMAPVGNVPVGQHPYIIRLLRGVFNERPPMRRLVPEWDLLSVLGCLKKPPFEPMREASLKYVTWKACFLLAITTFRRCSDLQSLTLGEGLVNVQRHGVTFLRTGLAKTDRPNHQSNNIFVPHFPNDKLLDPKRALTYYLRCTEKYRSVAGKDVVKLFLAINKPHQPVSQVTISRWLVSVIKYSHCKLKKHSGKVTAHSTRSMGPSWALFKGASLKQVLEAADWSRETTFTKHYLTNVALNTNFLNVK